MQATFPILPVSVLDEVLTDRIRVYRYDPVMETVERHWMLPLHILEELYICTYALPTDEDGDVINSPECLHQILQLHRDEDVVLIY